MTRYEIQEEKAFDDCYSMFKDYIINSLNDGYKVDEIIEAMDGGRVVRNVVEAVKNEN